MTFMIRSFLVSCVSLSAIAAIAGDEKTDDLKKFQGQWRVLRIDELENNPLPQKELAKMSVEFKGNTFIMENSGRKEQPVAFTIDPTKKPKTIDFVMTEKLSKKGEKKVLEKKVTIPGIYMLKGKQLTIAYADPGAAKPERPKEFRATKASLLMVLEKKT